MNENVVFIVTCYQNIVNVYREQEDAAQCQRELVLKGRPADIVCRAIVEPLKTSKK